MNIITFTPPAQQIPVIACTEALSMWIERLAARGKAERTIKAYAVDVIDALRVFARHDAHVVAVVSAREVEAWLDDQHRRGRKPRSQARALSAARGFFKFCQQQRWCSANPAEAIRIKFRPARVTAPELDVLMRVIKAIPHTQRPQDVRDRAILRLALDAGLRAGGIESLNVPADREPYTVDLRALTVTVRNKGGATTDPIAINQTTADAIAHWLQVRHQLAREGQQALFVGTRGERICRQTLNLIARKRGRAAGVDGLYIHLFRHRRIGELVERVGIKMAQQHAGHSSEITTVAVYGSHAGNVTRKMIRQHADIDALSEGRAA